ncbi:MAG: PH domain-containing protein [Chloroflexi bacterium]|nr:PH domain-containing protein [Chloroflexota bacterium]MDA1145558.1 PH domain-containing protein [Chloroflexota bacterium]
MTYQPPRALGMLVGGALTLWALAIAALIVSYAVGADFGFTVVLTVTGALAAAALASLFGYWTYALGTLSYALDRNGLVIHWGATRQVIPLSDIERLVPGTSVGVPAVRGVSWLGYHVGSATIDRIGNVLFYSTHQAPEQVLYVMTSERNYAISVTDPAGFARQVQIRQDLGPTARVTHHAQRLGSAAQAFWYDPTGRILVGVALVAAFVMWSIVGLRYPSLPAAFELQFPAYTDSSLVNVQTKDAILQLPRIATVLLIVNLLIGFVLHAWERVAGYVLFIAAAAVQLAFAAAVAIAVRGV